jgi:hypothetical protein
MANHDTSVWPDHARGDGRGNANEDLARSDAWKKADEARARANDLRAQADAANAEANRLEVAATAEFEETDVPNVDASDGTWEAAVSPAADTGSTAANGGASDEEGADE